MRRRTVAIGFVLSLLSAGVYAQLREKSPPAPGGVYRVTPWPDRTGPDQSYTQEVEEHLNKMAADGWRFHSDLAGQFGKMMVFERSSGR
jgi:hypothetical protein